MNSIRPFQGKSKTLLEIGENSRMTHNKLTGEIEKYDIKIADIIIPKKE